MSDLQKIILHKFFLKESLNFFADSTAPNESFGSFIRKFKSERDFVKQFFVWRENKKGVNLKNVSMARKELLCKMDFNAGLLTS